MSAAARRTRHSLLPVYQPLVMFARMIRSRSPDIDGKQLRHIGSMLSKRQHHYTEFYPDMAVFWGKSQPAKRVTCRRLGAHDVLLLILIA